MKRRKQILCYAIAIGLAGGNLLWAEEEPEEPEPFDVPEEAPVEPSEEEPAELPERDDPVAAERPVADLAERYDVPEETIEEMRAEGMGFGEIEIALALSARIEADGHVQEGEGLSTILAEREEGKGWGQIAQDHELNLGEVMRDVRTRAPLRTEEQPERPERPDRPERPERPDRPDRPDRPEQPDRPDRGPHE